MNLLFLAAEFLLVSAMLLGAYRLRSRFGDGPIVAVVASLQFVQAILGGNFYWAFSDGLSLSPGSCIFFAGNIAILLFAFARDGANSARTILYAIITGNVTCILASLLLAAHINTVPPLGIESLPVSVFTQTTKTAVVGILVLYLDQLIAVLSFAWLRARLGSLPVVIPLTLVIVGVLAFDTVFYLVTLFAGSERLLVMVSSGLVSKSIGGLAFGLLFGALLHRDERRADTSLKHVLGVLMFKDDIDTLREAAVRDELTGLYNRRSYNLIVEQIFSEGSQIHADGLALVLADADRFKSVNDVLGHPVGDDVLQQIATHLLGATRGDDFAFRLGGDEFAVLLPKASLEVARGVAQRIVEFRFEDEKLEHAVTMTVGVAAFPDDGDTPEAIFSAADRRLYDGKFSGKGKVVGPSGERAAIDG